MTTRRQRIIAQVDAQIAEDGLLDAVKSPAQKKVFNDYRKLMIKNAEAMAKLGLKPKP